VNLTTFNLELARAADLRREARLLDQQANSIEIAAAAQFGVRHEPAGWTHRRLKERYRTAREAVAALAAMRKTK
jgi:hypothetical protein